LPPHGDGKLHGFLIKNLQVHISLTRFSSLYRTHRFETLHELGRAFVVFEVLDDEHYNVVVVKFTEILDHQLLDERFQFAINQLLPHP
jgi:hypothetical protein